MTPEVLAASNTESGHQRAVFAWSYNKAVREQYPQLKWLFAVPNGGFRPRPIAAAMKAEGVKSGVPDTLLIWSVGNYKGLVVELKRPESDGRRKGTTSDEQDEWLAHFTSQGWCAKVCIGWQDATRTIVDYLEGRL